MEKIPMQLGARGWRITVPEGMAEKLDKMAQVGIPQRAKSSP